MKEEFSKAAWVRSMLLLRPDITLEQLQDEYDKDKTCPDDKRPDKMQLIWQARTDLCKRWGVSDVTVLPRNGDGKINVSGMIRLYLNKHGFESTHASALVFFEADGIALASGVFSNQKTVYNQKKEEGELTSGPNLELPDSPDANQNAGPRAGKSKRKKRRRATARPSNSVNFDSLLTLKTCVDELGGLENARQALQVLEKVQVK